jgi:hypothetical protein
MEADGQLHASAALFRRKTLGTLYTKGGGPQSRSGLGGKGKSRDYLHSLDSTEHFSSSLYFVRTPYALVFQMFLFQTAWYYRACTVFEGPFLLFKLFMFNSMEEQVFFSSPPRPNRIWGPPSLLSNGTGGSFFARIAVGT